MLRIISLLTIFFLGLTVSQAQTYNFKGRVKDKSAGITMPGSTIMLLNKADSTFYKYSITNADGEFQIKQVKAGEFILQISFIGYETFYKPITVSENTAPETDLGDLALNTKTEQIKTVEIQDELIPIIIKKDTIEYNAEAFKTQPDASVGDLLKKLPGVEVSKDGTVKAQGETVKKILIDGKQFFGDDTKLATENLPADMVKKGQVYDDQSDMSKMTGIDDGDRSKTINLKLKKDRKKGLFGNVEVGGGVDDDAHAMYENRFNINKFKENMQLSTLGMINNTNKQGFSYRDYINFVGGAQNAMGSGGFRNLTNNSNGVPISSGSTNDGLTETFAGGVNLNYDFTPEKALSGNYFYNQLDKDIVSVSNRQYITASDSSNFKALENNNENQFNRNHRLNLKYVQKIDSTQDLTLSGNFTFSDGRNNNYTTNDNINYEGFYLNRSNSNNKSTGDDVSGNGNILYGKRFHKQGRSLVTNLALGNFANQKDYTISTYNTFFVRDTTMLQSQDEFNNQFNYNGKISYTEPYAKSKYLELSYQRSNIQTEYKKDFFDVDVFTNNRNFNNRLSLNYINTFVFDQYGIGTKMILGKANVTTGVGFQHSDLSGEIKTTNASVDKTSWNVLPNLKINYQMASTGRITFDYSTNVQQPSIDQLQPTLNNSNPLNLYQGNPNLKSEYNHNATARLMRFNQFTFTNIFAMLSANYTQDKITNSQNISNNFVTTTTPINVDYDYFITGYLYYGTPIRPIKSKINIGANSSYNKSIVFINTIRNNVDRVSHSFDLSLENRNKDVVDAKIGSKISFNNTAYSENTTLNQDYISTQYYADLYVEFLKKYTFNTSAEYTVYSGDQFTNNPKIPIWKAFLSRKFLKGDAGLIKFSVYDIFNQNIGINRTSQFNYIEDQRVNSLGRYYLVSVSYKITRFGGKKKKTTEETN